MEGEQKVRIEYLFEDHEDAMLMFRDFKKREGADPPHFTIDHVYVSPFDDEITLYLKLIRENR